MSTIEPNSIKDRSMPKSKKSFIDSFLPLENTNKLISSDSKRDVRH